MNIGPTMDIQKAYDHFKHIYETHYPTKYTRDDGTWYWGSCNGDHGVSGYEFDIDADDDGLCYDYKFAAGVLGLPVVIPEKSPKRKSQPMTPYQELGLKWLREGMTLTELLTNRIPTIAPKTNTVTFTFAELQDKDK